MEYTTLWVGDPQTNSDTWERLSEPMNLFVNIDYKLT